MPSAARLEPSRREAPADPRSPISDKELWQCARQQLSQHGDHALVAAAQRMAELEKVGDREGYATWAGIALRIAKLGPQSPGTETRH